MHLEKNVLTQAMYSNIAVVTSSGTAFLSSLLAINLEMLKHINDLDFIENIKGSPYSAGGSTDF